MESLGEVAGPRAWGVAPRSNDPIDAVVDSDERYLRGLRGMAGRSVRNYLLVARLFLLFAGSVVGEVDMAALSAALVVGFVTAESGRMKVASAKATATRLRSFLRFLPVRGMTASSLVGAVPSVAWSRLASLPNGLQPAQVAALLGSRDRASAIEFRNYAILVVLARLGLRAGEEVAGLRLEDIEWKTGELLVGGKGSRIDRLPLPVDVGEAIAAWLLVGRRNSATT